MSTAPNPPTVPPTDPLRAEPTGFERVPLLRDELAPLRPPMLEISPITRRMENLDAMRILCMCVIIFTHVTEPFIDTTYRREHGFGALSLRVLALNVAARFGE